MYTSDALNWRFSRMTRRAGIGHWHAHEGRHTAVSIMSSNGVPPPTLAARTQHSHLGAPIVEWVAGWSARHRIIAVTGWLLLVALAFALGQHLGMGNIDGGDDLPPGLFLTRIDIFPGRGHALAGHERHQERVIGGARRSVSCERLDTARRRHQRGRSALSSLALVARACGLAKVLDSTLCDRYARPD